MFQLPHHLIAQFCSNEKKKNNYVFSFCKLYASYTLHTFLHNSFSIMFKSFQHFTHLNQGYTIHIKLYTMSGVFEVEKYFVQM